MKKYVIIITVISIIIFLGIGIALFGKLSYGASDKSILSTDETKLINTLISNDYKISLISCGKAKIKEDFITQKNIKYYLLEDQTYKKIKEINELIKTTYEYNLYLSILQKTNKSNRLLGVSDRLYLNNENSKEVTFFTEDYEVLEKTKDYILIKYKDIELKLLKENEYKLPKSVYICE